jgi:hypothetical protein
VRRVIDVSVDFDSVVVCDRDFVEYFWRHFSDIFSERNSFKIVLPRDFRICSVIRYQQTAASKRSAFRVIKRNCPTNQPVVVFIRAFSFYALRKRVFYFLVFK